VSAGLEGFELVSKGTSKQSGPQLTIYANGGGYLNAASFDVLGQCPAVRTFVGVQGQRIAVMGADSDAEQAYALHRETESSGGDFRAQSMLRDLGVDIDTLGETHQIPLSVHDDADDVLVGDASALLVLDEDTDADATDTSTTDSSPDPDHSSAEPDVPAIEDHDEASTVEKVRAHCNVTIDGAETLETTCGEIGDAIGEDGRAVPHALKKLEDYHAQKLSKESDNGASVWAIAPAGAAIADSDDDSDVQDDTGTDGDDATGDGADKTVSASSPGEEVTFDSTDIDTSDLRYWCGHCGEGPWTRTDGLKNHHDREDHSGEPMPRSVEPLNDELLMTDGSVGNFSTDNPVERVSEWITGIVPDRTQWTVEDVAIECDLKGTEARTALDELDMDDYVIDVQGRFCRMRASTPSGGGD